MAFEAYIKNVAEDKREAFEKLLTTIQEHMPKGFEKGGASGMPSFVVPLKSFPKGYHCTPGQPLGFVSLAAQKNFIALYHMGIYASPQLLEWFVGEYPKHCKTKLDMGKSCIRFKKLDDIPYGLIAELMEKMTMEQWIDCYENALSTSRNK